jgi:toxin ParE1/3/4
VRILKTNQYAGRMIPEIDDVRYWELIEGNFRIICRVPNEIVIDILTVHLSARDLTKRNI